ncbi:MAG: FAD-dependent oxidoreductase [Actinobacteria bacterium]|nr:FAD-dependent oxidoreductase [Actinomycetota bacterium]MCI0679632.1 FAD-dependent oxidoreductase [Actinomycetota bacterium]
MSDTGTHLLILGAGPAGTQAATIAASKGGRVTLVEDQVVGGAAHLWDCIPSKTMAASALRHTSVRNAVKLGLINDPGVVDTKVLSQRIDEITSDINENWIELLGSQTVEIIGGRGVFVSDHEVVVTTQSGERRVRFDKALISTGSGPRVPDWAPVDGVKVLTTRDCYHLDVVPEHVIVIGSGVTGVEFTHIFESLGSEVSLVVSRQQVLPHRDPEVAAVLEEDFLERGVRLVIGARAKGIEVDGETVSVACDDGRRLSGSHALLAVGSVPLSAGLGLEEIGVETDDGYVKVDEYQRTTVPHIYAGGDVTGQMLLSSVASMQGRKIARHALNLPVQPLDYSKVAEAIFTEPEIASVGLVEVQAAALGRKVRTTKVPFASNARSVLQHFERGFVKVTTDPATGVVLGGTIVGHRASELIGVIALAVQARVTAQTLLDTLMVHPSMTEAITDAAE